MERDNLRIKLDNSGLMKLKVLFAIIAIILGCIIPWLFVGLLNIL